MKKNIVKLIVNFEIEVTGENYLNVKPFASAEDAVEFYELNQEKTSNISLKSDYQKLSTIMKMAVDNNAEKVFVKRNEGQDWMKRFCVSSLPIEIWFNKIEDLNQFWKGLDALED